MFSLIRKLYAWVTREPIIIHLYYSFKYRDKIYLRGRILQNRLVISKPTDRAFKSFVKFVRRLMTDEQRFKLLTVSINNDRHQFSTDQEGYFEISLSCNTDVLNQIILSAKKAEDVCAEIKIIHHSAPFGIITDIDDTILRTGVASIFKWRLLVNTLFINPWKRESFKDTSELFNQLTEINKPKTNPIFYISNSPWNIYNYLDDYLNSKGFPNGPLLLRDFNLSWFKSKEIREQNKYKEIYKILAICTDLSFILVGDSGEHDADIYSAINTTYPDRIKAIYIREIPKSKRSNKAEYEINKLDGKGLMFKESHEIMSNVISKGLFES